MRLSIWLFLPVLSLFAGCSVNPATGERQLSFIGTGQEIAMGRQADSSIVQSMGLYEDEALAGYVEQLGREMAAISERPELPWTFRVVDDPVINAFALPGGFIYMTRGILSHFNSEAQLASVVGHEIGHVTARHSVNRLSRQQLASLGLGIGSVLSPEVAQFQGLISSGLQLAFLSFGREDEREADRLGLRYLTRTGYEPSEMPGVYRMLARSSGDSGSRAPEWLSTHPDPENREAMIQELIAGLPPEDADGTVGREEYLQRLDGLVFGQDPRNGYFVESTFLHPELRFRIDLPAGWQAFNQPRQVVAQPESGEAVIVLQLSAQSTPDAAATAFDGQEGVRVTTVSRDEINGLPAVRARFEVRMQQTNLAGSAAFISYGDRVYELLGYTTIERVGQYRGAFDSSHSSFDTLRDPGLLSVEPRRLEIVRIDRSMSLEEFNDRYPSSVPLERIAVMNQVETGERLQAGRLMKRVIGEDLPERLP